MRPLKIRSGEFFRGWQSIWVGRTKPAYDAGWTFSDIAVRLPNERDRYAYFLWMFQHVVPSDVRDHRKYFSTQARGFGEDAFVGMWFALFRQCRPRSALEIGVHRAQVWTLWGLLARNLQIECDVWGLSPLTAAGDSVSVYTRNLDYRADIESHFTYFDLGFPHLVEGYSQEDASIEFVKSRYWDLIYVDGCHDLDVVLADLELSIEQLAPGGLLVVDDASLYAPYRPPTFSFAGHPGPSRAIKVAPGMSHMSEVGTCGHNRVFQKRS